MMRSTLLGLAIAVTTMGGGAAAEPRRAISNPDFARVPTGNDLIKHLPRRFVGARRNGAAEVECIAGPRGELTDCEVMAEAPAREGLGLAAVELAKHFRLKMVDSAGKSVVGGVVRIPIRFSLSKGAIPLLRNKPGRPAVALKPSKKGTIPCPAREEPQRLCDPETFGWDETPNAEEIRAQLATVPAGEPPSMLICIIGSDLRLAACGRTAQPSPAAAAAMFALAPSFKAREEKGNSLAGLTAALTFSWEDIRSDIERSREGR